MMEGITRINGSKVIPTQPVNEAEAPDRRGEGRQGGDEDAVPAPEVGPEQGEDHGDGEHQEEHDLEGVLEDPAYQDRVARDVDRGVLVLLVGLDLLRKVEYGGEGLATVQAVGDEARGDEGALLVEGDEAPVDIGRILPHQGAEGVGVFLGLGQGLHEDLGLDVAGGLDLDDPGVVRRHRSDLIVVDGVGGVAHVEALLDLAGRQIQLLELVAQLLALFGVAVVALSVQALGDAVDLRDGLGGEDRAVLHHHREGDRGGASEEARELVLGADEGMVRPLGPGLGVDPHGGPGQRSAHGRQPGIEDRVEEEARGGDQEERDEAPPSHDALREPHGGRIFGGLDRRCFGHGYLWVDSIAP
jgi:hypothetical protein